MVIPHNTVSKGSQRLGRSFFRKTLLGAYRNTLRSCQTPVRRGAYFEERVREGKDR
jgi:hypothetical protein